MVGCEHTTACASDNTTAPPRARLLTAAFAAQLSRPRYEPATLAEPAPMLSVPENEATVRPLAAGHANCETPLGRPVRVGSDAFSPTVGCEHTTTWASDSRIEPRSVRLVTAAFSAQLFFWR